MGQSAAVKAENAEGTHILFGLFVENAEALRAEGVNFSANSIKSSQLGSGLPQVSDLIVAFGSAGLFTTVASVIIVYLKSRPKGVVRMTIKKPEETIEIRIEHSDAAQIVKALTNFLLSPNAR